MTIYLKDSRRELVDLVPKIQHLCGGLPLLIEGLDHVRGNGHESAALGWLEIALAGAVLFAFVKELRDARQKARGHHSATHHPALALVRFGGGSSPDF